MQALNYYIEIMLVKYTFKSFTQIQKTYDLFWILGMAKLQGSGN